MSDAPTVPEMQAEVKRLVAALMKNDERLSKRKTMNLQRRANLARKSNTIRAKLRALGEQITAASTEK